MRLLHQLPRDSHFQAAWHTDEEAAREYVRQHPDPTKEKPTGKTDNSRPLSEWSPEVELLTALLDEIRNYRADYAAVSSQGKRKRQKVDPAPRPVTALEKVRKDVREERASLYKNKLLPESS